MATESVTVSVVISRTEGQEEAIVNFGQTPPIGFYVGSVLKINNKLNGVYLPDATIVGILDSKSCVVTGLSEAGVSDPFEIPDNELGTYGEVLNTYPMGDVS